MGLFQIGYRRYEGQRTPQGLRWLPITRTGLALSRKSKLVRWASRGAFLPFVLLAPVFFLIGRLTDPVTASEPVRDFAQGLFGRRAVQRLIEDPDGLRTAVWAAVFAGFGALFQLWMVAFITAFVGPTLVSSDIRSRSFLIYFARPISGLDYVIGKAGVLVVMLAKVTLLPSLLLYAMSILLSPSLGTVLQTSQVVLTIVLTSLGTIIPVALVMLMLSSLVRQPRYAAAAWIVICVFGLVAHLMLQNTQGLQDSKWTFLLSPAHTIRAFQLGLYDVRGKFDALGFEGEVGNLVNWLSSHNSASLAAGWLLIVSIVSLLILLRRVGAPTRI